MPVYDPNELPRIHKGPARICECGSCYVCKNRERQKRFREKRQLEKEFNKLVTSFDDDDISFEKLLKGK